MSMINHYETYNYDEMMNKDIIFKSKRINDKNEIKKIKTGIINKLFAALMIVMVFGSMAYLLIRYAEINEIKYKNFELKQEIESISIQEEELKYAIDSTMSLNNIENYAVDKLGMQYPQDYQIVYIETQIKYALNVEKSREVLDNDSITIKGSATEEKSFVASIIDRFWN
ncbi:MAG: hypothetical protein U9Q80_02705 [Bacillota bacterium]|nr:hypothetical protein [Bacillota bacterium]